MFAGIAAASLWGWLILAQDSAELSIQAIRDKAATLSDEEFRASSAVIFASWQKHASSENPPSELFAKTILDRFVSLGGVEILQALIFRANTESRHSDSINDAIERAARARLPASGYPQSRLSLLVVAAIRVADDDRARRYLATCSESPEVMMRVLDCRARGRKGEFDAVASAQCFGALGEDSLSKDELTCRTARQILVSGGAAAIQHFAGEIESWVVNSAAVSGGADFWRAVLEEILLRPSPQAVDRILELARSMEAHLGDKELQARTCLRLAAYQGRRIGEPAPGALWRMRLLQKALETAASDELRGQAAKALVEERLKAHQLDAAIESIDAAFEKISDSELRAELAALKESIHDRKAQEADFAAAMEREQKRQGLEGRLKALRALLAEYKKAGRSADDLRLAEEEIRKVQEELDALKQSRGSE